MKLGMASATAAVLPRFASALTAALNMSPNSDVDISVFRSNIVTPAFEAASSGVSINVVSPVKAVEPEQVRSVPWQRCSLAQTRSLTSSSSTIPIPLRVGSRQVCGRFGQRPSCRTRGG